MRLQGAPVLAAVLALAGCMGGEPEREPRATPPEPAEPTSGEVSVAEGELSADGAAYVLANRLHLDGAEEVLRAVPRGPLLGTLSPVAVPAPDGGLVAYNAWRGRRPVVRVYDVDRNADALLDDGALSVAWGSAGGLAYFKGLPPTVPDDPREYVGHLVVRESPDAPATRWTDEPARYVAAAWAGGRLLAYRLGTSWPALLALDGPGQVRTLDEAGALVAVSPDGRRAVVARYGSSPPLVRLLDVESGDEVARLVVSEPELRFVSESGSWQGDVVVAPSAGSLAVLRVTGAGIDLEQVLRFSSAALPVTLHEPRLDDSGRRVVAWGELPTRPREAIARAALVECDRIDLRCVVGPVDSSEQPPRPVYNPSRP